MNTVSISRAIEKATGLKKSEKQKDYTRDSGSGNIAYRLQRVDRWRNGDFHITKYYQNSYDLYLDNTDATKKGDDVVKVLEDLGCTNIIPHIDRKWIRFDLPTEEKILNGYERNAESLRHIFSRVEGETWTDKSGKTWMYKEGVPDQELDYDVNADVPDRANFRAYKMFLTKYNPDDPKTYKYKGLLFPLYINAKNGYRIGQWYKAGHGAFKMLCDENGEPILRKGNPVCKTIEKDLAYRPGLHMGNDPLMRHRGRRDLPHQGDNDFDYFHSQEVFAEVEYAGNYDYTEKSKERQRNSAEPDNPYSAGFTDNSDFENGYYKFKTNTNASDDQCWLIADAMKIIRVLTDEEVVEILHSHNPDLKPQMRGEPNGKDGDMFVADFSQFEIQSRLKRR